MFVEYIVVFKLNDDLLYIVCFGGFSKFVVMFGINMVEY